MANVHAETKSNNRRVNSKPYINRLRALQDNSKEDYRIPLRFPSNMVLVLPKPILDISANNLIRDDGSQQSARISPRSFGSNSASTETNLGETKIVTPSKLESAERNVSFVVPCSPRLPQPFLTHQVDFYQFKWYRLLTIQILICSTEVAITSVISEKISDIVLPMLLYGGFYIPVAMICAYCIMFVILQQYRASISNVVVHYFHIPRSMCRTLYRTLMSACSLLSSVAIGWQIFIYYALVAFD